MDGRRLDGATDLKGLFDRPEFGVKEILAHRMQRKKLQYLVRWEGCSYLQSTWEDASSLATAPKVIKAYKAKTKHRDAYGPRAHAHEPIEMVTGNLLLCNNQTR